MSEEARQTLINEKLFGPEGLSMADTLEIFQQRVDTVIDYITNNCPNFAEYFSKRMVPTLQQNIWISLASGISPHVTNNNCESLNHVIKQLINYKPQPVHTLAKILIAHVKTQYTDVEKSFYGRGNYCLHSQYYSFRIDCSTYITMTISEKRTHFMKFLKYKIGKETT